MLEFLGLALDKVTGDAHTPYHPFCQILCHNSVAQHTMMTVRAYAKISLGCLGLKNPVEFL